MTTEDSINAMTTVQLAESLRLAANVGCSLTLKPSQCFALAGVAGFIEGKCKRCNPEWIECIKLLIDNYEDSIYWHSRYLLLKRVLKILQRS